MNAAAHTDARAPIGPTAEATVAAAFDGGPEPTPDRPLEAPSGQFEACVERLADRVEGDAADRVAQGAYTYEQAANLARGGKVAALAFDANVDLVRCHSAAGVTGVIRHAQTVWSGAYDEADDGTEGWPGLLGTAAAVAGSTASAVGGAVGWIWGEAKGRAVKRMARAALGKNPATLMFAAGPSVYRALVTGEVSYRQATKDLFEAGTGAAGAAAGAAIGATVGSVVPIVGTLIGGVTGGLLGASYGRRGGEVVADSFAPDDADALEPLARDELAALAFAHALVPAEVERLRTAADSLLTDVKLREWFKLYDDTRESDGKDAAAEAVRSAAREVFEPIVSEITTDRPRVEMPVG